MMQLVLAIDQLINTLFGGYADETISARVYRNRNKSWWWYMWLRIINCIFFWQDDHCQQSYYSELNRKHMPRLYRK